jgi:hypothetical protein
MSDGPRIARNCFEADSFIVEVCSCGCNYTKIYLIDKKNVVRAVASTFPGNLAKAARIAEGLEPRPDQRIN